MKSLSKTLLALYLITLLWLVLFKFSYDFSSVLLDHQSRSLNLIPFVGASSSTVREMIDNFVIFVPFGLLLSVSFKQMSFRRKITTIFIFSLAVEIVQFVLAIGMTDITDIITNTFGGLIGLMLYNLGKKYTDEKKIDWFIVIAGALLLTLLILYRTLVIHVRY